MPAEWDPHAFGWFPELNVLAIPVQGSGPVQPQAPGTDPATDEWKPLSDLYVFRIDTGAGAQAFQALGTVEHASSVTRSVRIDECSDGRVDPIRTDHHVADRRCPICEADGDPSSGLIDPDKFLAEDDLDTPIGRFSVQRPVEIGPPRTHAARS